MGQRTQSSFGASHHGEAASLIAALTARGERLATVESCTGGLLGAALSAIPGASAAYLGGWITYDDRLKTEFVGVPAALLSASGPGAVSSETAGAMAAGGRERSRADWCLAITGIAGPSGATPAKPVGTVWIALAGRAGVEARMFHFAGGRELVRSGAVAAAMAMLADALA